MMCASRVYTKPKQQLELDKFEFVLLNAVERGGGAYLGRLFRTRHTLRIAYVKNLGAASETARLLPAL